jgi:hypothetical protein
MKRTHTASKYKITVLDADIKDPIALPSTLEKMKSWLMLNGSLMMCQMVNVL